MMTITMAGTHRGKCRSATTPRLLSHYYPSNIGNYVTIIRLTLPGWDDADQDGDDVLDEDDANEHGPDNDNEDARDDLHSRSFTIVHCDSLGKTYDMRCIVFQNL